jgi:hypothetical protein
MTREAKAFLSPRQELEVLLAELNEPFPPETSHRRITRQKFQCEEDELLLQIVEQMGTSDWSAISKHFPNRTIRQIRERWRHYLDPDIVVGNWTEAENQLLIQQVEEIGPRWSVIAKSFPGRTHVGLKNHYVTLKDRIARDRSQLGQMRAPPTHPNQAPVGDFAQELLQRLQG